MPPNERYRLAEICGEYLGKGQLVAIEGRKARHWMVASSIEMLAGKRKKDYVAESAAQVLEAQAEALPVDPRRADRRAIVPASPVRPVTGPADDKGEEPLLEEAASVP